MTDVSVRDELRRPQVAGSLLLTVLAEHTLPGDGTVWQETIVGCLVALGHSVPAARQAVARAISDGWLQSERVGRRARMRLTGRAVATLTEGTEQILSFGAPREWDGWWLLVSVAVPGEQQELRRRLRTLLAWYGFGPLGNGLWITPRTEREELVPGIFGGEHEGTVAWFCFRSQVAMVSDAGRVIRTAWDLDGIEEGYRDFVAEFTGAAPDGVEQAFVADTRLSHAWRRFLFADPQLPRELLPADWPGQRAYELFHERNDAWRPRAHDFYLSLEERISSSTSA